MAMLKIVDYIDIGSGGYHDATSWFVAKDKDVTDPSQFTKLIDSSIKDKINVKQWYTPLPKLPEDGEGFYADETELYAYAIIWIGNYQSELFCLGKIDQTKQDVVITEEGQEDITIPAQPKEEWFTFKDMEKEDE